jgi:hypothetical protein
MRTPLICRPNSLDFDDLYTETLGVNPQQLRYRTALLAFCFLASVLTCDASCGGCTSSDKRYGNVEEADCGGCDTQCENDCCSTTESSRRQSDHPEPPLSSRCAAAACLCVTPMIEARWLESVVMIADIVPFLAATLSLQPRLTVSAIFNPPKA